ncbi:hypothetical protein V5G24_23045 [Xanthobacter sp. VTT E-85241]|uniref:hypothetical protein n=1 Tax=Roseixanthobacter finlandensis TaxID=3119922 RepID=UPI0037291642
MSREPSILAQIYGVVLELKADLSAVKERVDHLKDLPARVAILEAGHARALDLPERVAQLETNQAKVIGGWWALTKLAMAMTGAWGLIAWALQKMGIISLN